MAEAARPDPVPPRPARSSRGRRAPAPARAAPVLVVTADPDLLDDLARLAAAVDVRTEVVGSVPLVRRRWEDAPLVLVGPDLAAALADGPGVPTRRPDVVLVGRDLDDAGVWQLAVEVGAETVAILPDADDWLAGRLTDAVEGGGDGLVVAVVGGRGGAGATSLACALALTSAARRTPTMLVDGDPLGGGIDLVLGGEDEDGARWPELAATPGRLGGAALRAALPTLDVLTVLSWDRGDRLEVPAPAMREVLRSGRRSSGLVVVDLPRRLDDAAREAVGAAGVVLLVVPAEVRATAAAARVAAGVQAAGADCRLVVRGPAPSGLPAEVIAEALDLPLEGELRPEPGLAQALERGEPPGRRGRGPLAGFCSEFLDRHLVAGRRQQ